METRSGGSGPAVRPPGFGADGDRGARPGVPREWREPLPTGAWWDVPQRQPGEDAIGRPSTGLRARVFGTAQPARGLSGALRRAAYRLPEHRNGRWLVLLLADRLDVLEHRLRRGAWIAPAVIAVLAGYAAVARRR